MKLKLGRVALILTIAVAGCTTTPPVPTTPMDLSELSAWQARGRLAVASAESGGSGSFIWTQAHQRSIVELRGPAGLGSLKLSLRGDGPKPDLRLESSNGRVLEAEAAWDELESRLGAEVPAGYLRYWMLGMPAPGEHQWLQRSPQGAVLEQQGWRIEYMAYVDKAPQVPARIRASKGEARVRIVVDDWRFGL